MLLTAKMPTSSLTMLSSVSTLTYSSHASMICVSSGRVLPSHCFLFPREGIKGTRAVIWKSPQDYGSTNSYHYFLRDNQHQEEK